MWKRRYYYTLAAFVITNLFWSILAFAKPSATYVAGETMPSHVWATVIMFNGGTQCSATIITKDGFGIGAAHCFSGHIGGGFWVYHPDGTPAKATLVDHDKANDLALFKIDPKDVIDWAPFPEHMPTNIKSYDIIGYPKGVGPKYFSIQASNHTAPENNGRWVFDVPEGDVKGGNSGGGVFVDGNLCGVVSHRSGPSDKQLYCAPYTSVRAFLTKGKCDPFCPKPPGTPDVWKPNPNIPLPPKPGEVEPPAPKDEGTKAPAPPDSRIDDILSGVNKIKLDLSPIAQSLAKMDPAQMQQKLQIIESLVKANPEQTKVFLEQHQEEIKQVITNYGPEIKTVLEAQAPVLKDELGKMIQEQSPLLQDAVKIGLQNPVFLDIIKTAMPSLGLMPALALGGPAGIGIGFAGYFLSKLLKKKPQGQGPSLSDIEAIVAKLIKNQPGVDTETIITNVLKQIQPKMIYNEVPVGSTQVVTQTQVVPVESNTHSDAYLWAKRQIASKYPTQAEGVIGQLDSLIKQYLSGVNKNVS